MITVTKRDLIELGYGPSFAADIIKKAKELMVEKGHTYYQSRKLDRVPRALEKLANLAGVHRIKIHALRHSHASLLISMGENPLLIKERLGHEKIQTTLGTYGHLYPNTNIEIAKKLTGVLSYQSASQSIANYTSNQHTAMYHKEI